MEHDPKVLMYEFCKDFAASRMARIQVQIKEVQNALGSETKSSAGDKHETGRAMLQLEREKLGQQLAEAERMNQLVQKVDITLSTSTASLGSLVVTSNANYFLAISAGEFKGAEGKNYCISLNTPIGIMLLGKSVGDSINFNGSALRIEEIK